MLRLILPLDETAVRAKLEFLNHYADFVYTAAASGNVEWQNTDSRMLCLTLATARFNVQGALVPLQAGLSLRTPDDPVGTNNRWLDMDNPTWASAAPPANGTDMFCRYEGGLVFVPPRWTVEAQGIASGAGSHRLNLTIQGFYIPKGLFA